MCVCSLSYPACNAHKSYYIVTCGLFGSTAFSTLYHKRYHFLIKKMVEHKMCVEIFSTNFVWDISHATEELTEIWPKHIYWSSCKVHVILVRFQSKLNFLDRLAKKIRYQNLVKIRPVEAELFHADRRTDRHDEANGRFSRPTNAPKREDQKTRRSRWMSISSVNCVSRPVTRTAYYKK